LIVGFDELLQQFIIAPIGIWSFSFQIASRLIGKIIIQNFSEISYSVFYIKIYATKINFFSNSSNNNTGLYLIPALPTVF